MLAYLVSFVDRQVLVMMIEPMQRDLEINDTQFSLLHGLTFALFYTVAGLFVGRLVDSGPRVRIIAWAVAIWSAATVACGLVRGYAQLFIGRMVVGVGEAGLTPGTFSLLSDLFRADRRAYAFSIYSSGMWLGTGLAYVVGGRLIHFLETIPPVSLPVLGEMQSWRMAFLVVGLPGLALALLIRWLIQEPHRGAMEPVGATAEREPAATVSEFFSYVRRNWRAYGSHNIGFGFHMGLGYVFSVWIPALFMRVHGWDAAQVGTMVGLVWLICGPSGAIAGGLAARALRSRGDASSEITVGMVCCTVMGICSALLVAMPSPILALAIVVVAVFFAASSSGCNAAALQIVTPPRLRGQAAALFLLVGNVLGLGLMPLVVALVTDYAFGDKKMVGHSIRLVGMVAMPLAILLLWQARRYFRLLTASGTGRDDTGESR